ncbi:MAG: flavohemoglobin expression-modulating QEGLA motif protein [Gemmataceae bacterium]|nr:flavohemoglobin expression-modulating QEGLA motif protein [Gemmataceae bacterium]MDW8263936.1 flavohemoglobin expression-modulating QEGLA motif protein [Gemmataceae bacterium]
MVRALSDRLVEAQRPIRILDAIKWDDDIERAFFARGCRELPPVTPEYYRARPLPFDPEQKLHEFHQIERDIRRQLGEFNAPGQIMARMCQEYREVVHLLTHRGTRAFAEISERLYGSASDSFHAGDPNLADLGHMMSDILDNLSHETIFSQEPPCYDAGQVVELLSARLGEYFRDPSAVRVKLSDGIVADAAAGSDYIKIRTDARFTAREVRLLEVHEGWVHLGTTLNGLSQPVCTFLSKGPPSSTITQEGLAVLTELFAFASHPARVRRLTNRIRGVAMAEEGANFLEVYRYFLNEGYDARESYQHTMRIFRGSLPEGCGPFTKDLCYSKGFVMVYNYIRLAVRRGMVRQVPLLFCGKTNLADIKILGQLVEEGLVERPRFVPPQFADLHALTAWMCYANFLNRLSLKRIEEDYAALF